MLYRDNERVKTSPAVGKRKIFKIDQSYISMREKDGVKIPTGPMNMILPALYTYFDKNENASHTMQYAETVGTKVVGDKQILVFSPPSVTIHAGVIVCTKEQPDFYEWLTNHPWNQTNPNRDTKSRAIFYEYDSEKESDKRVEKAANEYEVRKILFTDTTPEQRRTILKSYGENNVDALSDNGVQDRLLTISGDEVTAKKDPRYGHQGFLNYVNAPHMKLKALIQDAQDRKIIKFEGKSQRWLWKTGDAKGNVIVPVPKGQNHVEYFIDWMLNRDDTGVKDEIVGLISLDQLEMNNAEKQVAVG